MDENERKDFILSRLNVGKKTLRGMEEGQVIQLIAELDQIRAESVEEGRYLDADNAKNKVKQVRQELERKRKKDLVSKHSIEKHKLDEEFEQELHGFTEFWNEKINKYQEECRQLENMLLSKNQEELEEYYESLNKTIPVKFKPSSKMLEMHATLNQLLKNQEYRDAHYLQQKICILEKQEEEKYFYERNKKIENLLQSMRQRHNQEYNTLKKKIILGLEELEINRKKEYEKLLLKFNNIKKNIENQHNMESYYFEKSVKTSQITKSLRNPFDSYHYGHEQKYVDQDQEIEEPPTGKLEEEPQPQEMLPN